LEAKINECMGDLSVIFLQL